MFRRILILIGVLFMAETALAQNVPHQNIALANVAGTTVILNNQPVYVCTAAGTGSPCSPQATIYSDATNAHPITQPLLTDSNGNLKFFAPPGLTYYINLAPNGFSSSFYYWTAPFLPTSCLNSNVQCVNSSLSRGGSDIGAEINLAIAALPIVSSANCGVILVGTGSYSFSTSIVKPRCVFIDFAGSTLTYTGSTQAIKVYDTIASGTIFYYPGGLRNGNLVGPSNSSGSSVGLYLGGDPAGVISPTNGQCQLQSFENMHIHNFFRGVQYGQNAYLMTFHGGDIISNGTGVYYPSNAGASENVSYEAIQINNNQNSGIQNDAGAEFNIRGGGIDYNGQASSASGPAISGTSTGIFGSIYLYGVHMEQTSGAIINFGSSTAAVFVSVTGGRMALTGTSGTTAAVAQIGGTNSVLAMRDVNVGLGSGQTLTEYVNWQSIGNGQLTVENIIWTGPGTRPTTITNAVLNTNLSQADTMLREHAGALCYPNDTNCMRVGAEGTTNGFWFRDLSQADAWWFHLDPLGTANNGITMFGGANLNSSPYLSLNGTIDFVERAAPGSFFAGNDALYGDSTAHCLKFNNNNTGLSGCIPQVVASGTATMTTAAITAGNCGTTVTVAAAGVATTDSIAFSFNAAPAGSNAGLVSWPTANNVNFAYCPNSAETPAAATINWRVVR